MEEAVIPVKIIYPVPMESPEVWATFKPFVERFCHSMRNTKTGCDYKVAPILNIPKDTDTRKQFEEFLPLFDGIPIEAGGPAANDLGAFAYHGQGCDFGSYQHYAKHVATENEFMVCMTTRCFAWKAGWLRRLVECREKHGLGLYGTSASREGGRLHVCTRAFGMDSDVWKQYPHTIDSRDQGTFVEIFGGNLMEWHWSKGLPAYVVNWTAETCEPNRYFEPDNIYRLGDQSNLLVKDKHSLIYDEASPERKKELERMCFDGIP